MSSAVLIRYGKIPEVSRVDGFSDNYVERGQQVIVETDRGMQMGTVLEELSTVIDDRQSEAASPFRIVRLASDEDKRKASQLSSECEQEFELWNERIRDWDLELQLIDIEWTIDRKKRILYVLNDRGPDCTKLALQAAAAGFGLIEVQPVNAEGLVRLDMTSGSGCGCSSGGGCHS